MNIVQVQDQLKNFSQEQLVREMQAPSGNTPQYLVLSEIMRRQRMQADSAAQQSKGEPQTTVADEAIAAAGVPQGGIADMARALAPKTDMAENTGIQAMAKGGPVKKMAEGDKVVRNGIIFIEQEDGTYLSEDGSRRLRSAGQDLRSGISALAELPSRAGTALGGISAGMADQMNADLRRTGEEAMISNMMPGAGRSGPITGIEERSFGQRYIGDPLRSMFQPIGEAAREVGQPIGEAAREVGQPIGESARDIGQPIGEAAREFFNPQAMVEPGAGRAGFPSARTYTPEQLAVMSAAQPAVAPPIISDIDSPYRRRIAETASTMEDLRAERAAPRKVYQPPPAPDRSGTMGTNGVPDVAGALAAIPETLATEVRIGPDGTVTMVPPAKEPVGRVDRDQQGIAAIPTPEEIAAEKEAAAATTTTDTSGGTGAGGAGGAGAAGGMSSYEQELMNALGRREKAAEQDKWLALAQVGLGMMSSTQPTVAGAIGEAGLKGVEAARSARDQYDKDRLDLLGAIEQSRLARAKASARGGSGVSGLKLKDYLGQMKAVADVAKSQLDLVTGGADPTMAIEMALDAGDNARALEIRSAYQQALAAQTEYMNTVRTVGGLDPMAAEEDDLTVNAMDE